eukprot:2032629-Pyramimonas_sp.AAC.1
MAGRVSRTGPGLVTYLFDFDDSDAGLASLSTAGEIDGKIGDAITLVLGPPSRLYLVATTIHHLRQRNFPNVHWLRMPEASELDVFSVPSNGRVMACWASVVLPLLRQL